MRLLPHGGAAAGEELGVGYDIRFYERDAITSLAPPELQAVHPLGKSPVIEDGDLQFAESGAIVDYLIRTYGQGALAPSPKTAQHEAYLEWLHFAEGSAMLPFMLKLYTARLGTGGAPLQPRIDEQIARHLAYVDHCLGDADWLVADTLSGADVMMSFVAEIAVANGAAAAHPRLLAYVRRLQARPAWQAALARGGPYRFSLLAEATAG